MKRTVCLAVALLMMISAFSILPLVGDQHAKDMALSSHVEKTRATLVVGPGQTYTTIQSAVDAASAGDTIYVYNGTYYENLQIGKSLFIRGNSSDGVIVNGGSSENTTTVTADFVEIYDMAFTNSGSSESKAGVFISAKSVVLEKCNVSGNYFGVQANGNGQNYGNCTFMDNAQSGVHLSGYYGSIKYSLFKNNQGSGISLFVSKYLNISYNTIVGNSGWAGITLGDSEENGIIYNSLINNNIGCYISDSIPDGNWVHHNSFVNNTINAMCNATSTTWSHGPHGNYWSNWTSPDSNSDGVVDIPYSIPGTGAKSDAYPLVDPPTNFSIPGPGPTYPPVITTTNIPSAYTGQLYGVFYNADDPDTPVDSLVWSMRTNAAWLTFTSSEVLTGTPGISDIGNCWVNISVTDGKYSDFTNFTLTVTSTNLPPVITTANDLTALEDALYMVDYAATDSDALIWSLHTNATFLSIVPSTGNLTGTPTNTHAARSFWVNVSVSDGTFMDLTNFTLTVTNVNDPPVIVTTPIFSVFEDTQYYCNFNATDPDPTNDVLTWTKTTDASFLNLDVYTGILDGTTDNGDIGSYNVSVTVSDNHGLSSHINYTLTVINVEDPPYLNGTLSNIVLSEDPTSSGLNANDIFKDQDSGHLTFSADSSGNISVTILQDGTIVIKSKAHWSGTEEITLHASDGAYTVSKKINVTIQPRNDPPYNVYIETDNPIIVEGQSVTLNGYANDPDIAYGDILKFKWSLNGTPLGTGPTITITLELGTYNITLVVSDSMGEASSNYQTIRVVKLTPPTDDDMSMDDDTNDTDDDDGVIGEQDTSNWLLGFIIGGILLVIVVVVVILVMVYLIVRSKNEPRPVRDERNRYNDGDDGYYDDGYQDDGYPDDYDDNDGGRYPDQDLDDYPQDGFDDGMDDGYGGRTPDLEDGLEPHPYYNAPRTREEPYGKPHGNGGARRRDIQYILEDIRAEVLDGEGFEDLEYTKQEMVAMLRKKYSRGDLDQETYYELEQAIEDLED